MQGAIRSLITLTALACSAEGVEPARERIELNQTAVAVFEGATDTLAATVYDKRGAVTAMRVTWSTGDSLIALVDTLGIVVGNRPGRTTVTATAGTLTRTIDVIVSDDATAPVLGQLVATPSAADLTSGDVTVNLSLGARDSESGVQFATVIAKPPSWRVEVLIFCRVFAPTGGTTKDGTWGCSWALNRYAEPGVWQAEATVIDRAGNASSAVLSFTVANSLPDQTPPALGALTYTDERTTLAGQEHRILVLRGSDSESGMQSIAVFVDHGTATGVYACSYGPDRPPETLGVWRQVHDLSIRCPVPLKQNSTPVVWTISAVRLRDVRGNERVYAEPDLQQAGFITQIDVSK